MTEEKVGTGVENSVPEEKDVIVYGRRWFMLFLGAFANLCNAILWISMAPITSVAAEYYDTSILGIVLLSLIFLVLYLPGSAIASASFQVFGVRKGLLIGAAMNFVAGVFRFASTTKSEESTDTYASAYAVLMVGQSIAAIAQPYFTNLPARFSAIWFPSEQRAIATTLFSGSNGIGIALGSILPSFFTFVVQDEYGADVTRVDMFTFMLVQVILFALSFGIMAVFLQEQPPTPPSKGAIEMNQLRAQQSKGVWSSLVDVTKEARGVLKDKEFFKVFMAAAIGLGFFNSFTTLVETITKPAGYSPDDASLFSGAFLIAGLVSAIIVGLVMDCTHKLISIFRILTTVACVALVFLLLSIKPDNGDLLTILFGVTGICMFPLLPVAFEIGAEGTYPINEDITTGLLMLGGQITGIVYILVMQSLIAAQPEFTNAEDFKYEFTPTYWISIVSIVIFWVFAMWYNGPYLRLTAERESKTKTPVAGEPVVEEMLERKQELEAEAEAAEKENGDNDADVEAASEHSGKAIEKAVTPSKAGAADARGSLAVSL